MQSTAMPTASQASQPSMRAHMHLQSAASALRREHTSMRACDPLVYFFKSPHA